MATAPNPFQQFISGLFGNLSGTTANKTSTPSTAGSSTYAGPYAPGKAPVASSTPKTDPRIGANASYVNVGDAINSKAAAAGIPYIPANKQGYGGMSIAPTMTSAATGKGAANVPGVINPKADKGYVNPLNVTPGPGASNYSPSSSGSRGSTSVSTGSFAPAAAAAPAAPPQAPASAGSYSSPSEYTGGGSTPMAGGSTGGSDYRTKYVEMLSGLYDPEQLKSSQESLNAIRKRAADAQLGERKEERRIRENEVGQGLRSFNGQLTENSRKSSAELADLAIAANPFEQYITQAQSAAKDIYGVGRDQTSDDRAAAADALAERKFQEDVRQFGMKYALDQATEARIAANANKPDKATKQDYVGQFAQAFTPGRTMADGTPTVDQNGYITPKAFKEAAAEAVQYGITRKEFIELFGGQIYTDKNGVPDPSYGLTQVEKKLVGVKD